MGSMAIRSILLAKPGTLASPLVDGTMLPVSIGLRNKADLETSDIDTSKDFGDREYRNKMNYKLSAESKQIEIAELDRILTFCKLKGVDAQIVSVDGSVINLTGANYAGIGFEYELSNKERKCSVNVEGSYEYDTGKSIWASAVSPTIPAIAPIVSPNKVLPPYVTSIYFDSYPVSLQDLKDYKLNIKYSGDKTLYNKDRGLLVNVTMEINTFKCDVSTIVNLQNLSNFPLLVIEQKNLAFAGASPDTNNNRFRFESGTVSLTVKTKLEDKTGTANLKIVGSVYLDNIVKSNPTDYAQLTFSI